MGLSGERRQRYAEGHFPRDFPRVANMPPAQRLRFVTAVDGTRIAVASIGNN